VGGNWAHGGCQLGYAMDMSDPEPQPPAEDVPTDEDQPRRKPPSPHEKPPPENPPVDEYDLERGKANLDRVIAK
jgi:hypothetical protein